MFDEWFERVHGGEPTFVYLMYDEHEHLLYVGITNDLMTRMRSHYREKPWIEEVSSLVTSLYPSREEAKARESRLIQELGPVYNVAENQSLENVVSYFGMKLEEACPASEGVRVVTKMLTATVAAAYSHAQTQQP